MECQYHGRTVKDVTTLEWSWPNALRQTMRVARARTREGSWALGSPEENGGGILDNKHCMLYAVEFGFCFNLAVTVLSLSL